MTLCSKLALLVGKSLCLGSYGFSIFLYGVYLCYILGRLYATILLASFSFFSSFFWYMKLKGTKEAEPWVQPYLTLAVAQSIRICNKTDRHAKMMGVNFEKKGIQCSFSIKFNGIFSRDHIIRGFIQSSWDQGHVILRQV